MQEVDVTQVMYQFSTLEIAMFWVVLGMAFLHITVEHWKIRKHYHGIRDKLAEVDAKINSVMLDNRELAEMRNRIEQLKSENERQRGMIFSLQEELKKERSIIDRIRKGAVYPEES